MRIGLSSTSMEMALNRNIRDGMSHYTHQLYHSLTAQNHDVLPYAFPRMMKKHSTEISQILPRSYVTQITGASLGLYKKISLPIDIFHSTDYRVVPMDCPVVASIWDAVAFTHPEWMRKRIGRSLVPILFKQSAKYADRVICGSKHAAEEIHQYFDVPQDRIRVVAWTIADSWIQPQARDNINAVRKKYHLPDDYILSVGTLQPRKNFGRLIDAFLSIPKPSRGNVKLVIVGKYGWDYDDVLEKIRDNPADIIHLDNVDNDTDMQCIYQAARIFAFPSLYEGFGMPVLEAFASKTPVIASNLTSVPEIAGDGALLIDPYCVESLSDALCQMLSNPDLQKKMIEKASQRLLLFTGNAMMEQTVKVYQELF